MQVRLEESLKAVGIFGGILLFLKHKILQVNIF